MTRTERDMAERFARETAKHEMAVLKDDGLYRHLKFSNPECRWNCWFELITTPHCLVFRGDGESFVFSRLEDMFKFFRSGIWKDGSLHINAHYWAEKLTSDRDSVMKYDQGLFEQLVKEHVAEAILDRSAPRGISQAIKDLLENGDITWEGGARQELENFEFGECFKVSCKCGAKDEFDDRADARKWADEHVKESKGSHVPSIERLPAFSFSDTWEWSFRDYDWWFLWALNGIVWGISQYDALKAAAASPPAADEQTSLKVGAL